MVRQLSDTEMKAQLGVREVLAMNTLCALRCGSCTFTSSVEFLVRKFVTVCALQVRRAFSPFALNTPLRVSRHGKRYREDCELGGRETKHGWTGWKGWVDAIHTTRCADCDAARAKSCKQEQRFPRNILLALFSGAGLPNLSFRCLTASPSSHGSHECSEPAAAVRTCPLW